MSAPTLPPATFGATTPTGEKAPRRGRRSAGPAPVATRLALPPSRRRPGRAAASAAVLAIGAAVGFVAFTQARDTSSVLVVARVVPAGTVLSRADLTVSQAKPDPALQLVPASALDSAVGQVTAVELRPGTTLSRGQLGGATTPTAGQRVIGLSLRPGLLPVRPLASGDRVELIETPDASGASGTRADAAASGTAGAAAGLAGPTAAVVTEVGRADSSGSVVVDVMVTEQVAPVVTAEAAAGRVALILQPRAVR